ARGGPAARLAAIGAREPGGAGTGGSGAADRAHRAGHQERRRIETDHASRAAAAAACRSRPFVYAATTRTRRAESAGVFDHRRAHVERPAGVPTVTAAARAALTHASSVQHRGRTERDARDASWAGSTCAAIAAFRDEAAGLPTAATRRIR